LALSRLFLNLMALRLLRTLAWRICWASNPILPTSFGYWCGGKCWAEVRLNCWCMFAVVG